MESSIEVAVDVSAHTAVCFLAYHKKSHSYLSSMKLTKKHLASTPSTSTGDRVASLSPASSVAQDVQVLSREHSREH
jgi:hypothetical protein